MRLAAEVVKGTWPWIRKAGGHLGGLTFYLITSGVLLMFAEGTRDAGRAHFRELVYQTKLLKRPEEESNPVLTQIDRIEQKLDTLISTEKQE